nr:glycoside hydrolase family 55 protein [Actinopolymorpha rutila]
MFQFLDDPQTLKIDDIRIEEKVDIPANPRVVHTTLGSADVPIASYDVTEWGAKPDDDGDDTATIQAALDAAGEDGGGVVFAPAGRYDIKGNLVIPASVTLRGDWASPDAGGLGKGTILAAYAGRGDASGTPFITTHDAATVRGLTIWYPEQDDAAAVQPYPWTIQSDPHDGYYGPNLFDLTFVNSYRGVKIAQNNGHFVRNVYGTFLDDGFSLDAVYDIGRLQSVHLGPAYWSGWPATAPRTVPSEADVRSYLRSHATGVTIFKSDWEYLYALSMDDYEVGMRLAETPFGSSNGQAWGIHTAHGKVGLQVDSVNEIGFVFSHSSFETSGPESVSVFATQNIAANPLNGLMFNDVTLGAPDGTPVQLSGTALLSFAHATFTDWSTDSAAIRADSGSVSVTASRFLADKPDACLGAGVSSAVFAANTFAGAPDITNLSKGDVKIDNTTWRPTDFPAAPTADPGPEPVGTQHPDSDALHSVSDYGAQGNGIDDDTSAFAQALNAASAAGGGTVYVPAGRYRLTGHIKIPRDVELRGVADGPHHYGISPRGSVLVATENEGKPSGTAFITLSRHAGVRGLSVYYPYQRYDKPIAYPATIATGGVDAYAVDVTLPDSYTGISVTKDGFSSEYLRGLGLKTFVSVVGADGVRIDNAMNSVGDWQDGAREANAPPANWWLDHPSSVSSGFELTNSDDAVLFNDFGFGVAYGLVIGGSSSNIRVHGHGVDNSERAIQLTGTGYGIDFTNTQLVAIGGGGKRYLDVAGSFSGKARFFNSLAWACTTGSDIAGSGSVVLQQWKSRNSGVQHLGGTLWMDSSFGHTTPQLAIGPDVRRATAYANVGNGGFVIDAQSQQYDARLNIAR